MHTTARLTPAGNPPALEKALVAISKAIAACQEYAREHKEDCDCEHCLNGLRADMEGMAYTLRQYQSVMFCGALMPLFGL